jgi:hypothetical protein
MTEIEKIDDKMSALRFAQDVIATLQTVNPLPVNPHDVAMLSELYVDLAEIRSERELKNLEL